MNKDLKIKTFNPKVSIIILSYNQAEYIKEAISSALNQTYTNLEIIISDNGSTDSTKQIIKIFFINLMKLFYIVFSHHAFLSIN